MSFLPANNLTNEYLKKLNEIHKEKLRAGEIIQTTLPNGKPGPLRIVPGKFQSINIDSQIIMPTQKKIKSMNI